MILDVTADLRDIKIMPSNELEEIVQNVQCILATAQGAVPLDREFGTPLNMLDAPISATQARLTAQIVRAIRAQEPRAYVQKVTFAGSAADGQLKVAVRIEIDERNLRGYVFK